MSLCVDSTHLDCPAVQGMDGFCGFLATDTSVLGLMRAGALVFLGLVNL